MRNGHEGRERVCRRQDPQRARAQDGDLTEQQHGRDEVVHDERRFVRRNEGPEGDERGLGERRRRDEDRRGREDDGECEATIAIRHR
jgi:hypothetical protein